MKNFICLLLGTVLALSACAHEDRADTRSQSFEAADTNKDMRLTYGEYKAYLGTQAGHGDPYAGTVLSSSNLEKSYLKSFQQADLDNDTFVTRIELMTSKYE